MSLGLILSAPVNNKDLHVSFIASLKACAKNKNLLQGSRLHADIENCGLLEKNPSLGNTLVSMYAKCGALAKAQQVLDALHVRDVVSWNALITGYAQQGQGSKAIDCFEQMQSEGVSPDGVTYSCTLKACSIMRAVDRGKRIHDEIVSQDLLRNDIVLGNALVDMYSKCGALVKAQKVIDELPARNVVSWSTLIAGYAHQGLGWEALMCLQRMRSEGLSPNAMTYASILKACGMTKELPMGEQIHDEIVSQGLLRKDVVLGNALVDMYAKCGVFTKAQKVLGELPVRDMVSWSALIAEYTLQGQGKEALKCFQQMRQEGLSPNAITYACILRACSMVHDVDQGSKIHDEIVSQGLLERCVDLGNSLVEMYAKCGVFAKALSVLAGLPERDVFSWSALIAGYAEQGKGNEALDWFKQMRIEGLNPDVGCWNALIGVHAQQGLAHDALDYFWWMQHEGTSPNAITFVCVLNACSHSGLVDVGEIQFDGMMKNYGITPNKEHFACMVDLFSRARHFDKAMKLIREMPSSDDDPSFWCALLSACQKWGNVKLARWAFEHAVEIDGRGAAPYVLMADIYAVAGIEDDP